MDVFDKNGAQQNMAWLRQKYGNVRFLDAGAGTKFRLVRVDETTGPATIVVRVLNAQGGNQNGQPVANHWPDDTLQNLTEAGLKTLWQPRAAVQQTDGGHTGYGIGTGSYIRDLTIGGPHTIWVLSPSLKSDGLAGVGMLGGTNHDGPLSLVFQIGADEPEHKDLRAALLWHGEQKQVIEFNPAAALQKAIFAAGYVPNSPEFPVVFDEQLYVAQRSEHLASGVVRVYYARHGDWGNVMFVERPRHDG